MSNATVQLIRTSRPVEVVPGKYSAVSLPREAVPKYGVVDLKRLNDGTYLPVLQTHGSHVRLCESTARQLGLDLNYRDILRLVRAGFVKFKRPTPNKTLLDLESLFDHIRKSGETGFWTRDRIEAYRTAINLENDGVFSGDEE